MKVAIIMGSTSDLPKVEPAISILKNYGVEVNVRCLSAHRAHLGLSSFIKETETDGTEVIITAAGMAAAHDCRMTEEVISVWWLVKQFYQLLVFRLQEVI